MHKMHLHNLRNLLLVSLLPLTFSASACAISSNENVPDHHDDASDPVGTTSSALSASNPVSDAITASCSTTAVVGLATQLVEEIQCMKPGSMEKIDNIPGLSLGSAVFPYLQTSAANALIAAQKARGVTMSINSGLRTLPQQYLLYRWYQTGHCGIALAASPGTSNHESGIAVDLDDHAAWESAMASKDFKWFGSSDPVHFDFTGGGTIDMKGLSVQAFQRLWNRNNPNDQIDEDGSYGPTTEARIAKSPVGGFAMGASCTQAPASANDPKGAATPQSSAPAGPSGGDDDNNAKAQPPGNAATTAAATLTAPHGDTSGNAGGCSIGSGSGSRSSLGSGAGSASGAMVMMIAILASLTRRRRRVVVS